VLVVVVASISPMRATGIDRSHDLLRDLRAADRALLEFRFVDGWQYGDIAVHLGVPHDVLTDRIRRLRTDLRRKAKALGVGKVKLNLAALMIV
jgi:DNA-directed RNA polymerase specialized sigma24 family protein